MSKGHSTVWRAQIWFKAQRTGWLILGKHLPEGPDVGSAV